MLCLILAAMIAAETSKPNSSMYALGEKVEVEFKASDLAKGSRHVLKIEVADGARLQLDFAGTNKIDSLRIAGKSYEGLVSVETHPELFPTLAGPGTLMIMPKGTVILFR